MVYVSGILKIAMLALSNQFLNRPVMSLRTGGRVGTAVQPIINPNNLKIEGFYVDDRVAKGRLILLTQDIRDMIPQGFVIDDRDVMSEPDDLVRLKEILQINFQLMNKPVVTVNKRKVGKVSDWAAETTTLYIQKLYAGRSLLRSLNDAQLSIDRTQIVEITDRQIVIQEILKPEKEAVPVAPTVPAT